MAPTLKSDALQYAFRWAEGSRDYPGLSALQGHSRAPLASPEAIVAVAQKFEAYLAPTPKRKAVKRGRK